MPGSACPACADDSVKRCKVEERLCVLRTGQPQLHARQDTALSSMDSGGSVPQSLCGSDRQIALLCDSKKRAVLGHLEAVAATGLAARQMHAFGAREH